jgi:hypothetical protein
MANAYGNLGQSNDGAVLDDLVTVGASDEAIVWVNIANKGATDRTYRIKHAPGGAADNDDHNLVFDAIVKANDSIPYPNPIYCGNSDVIRVYASHVDVTFSAHGITISP